MSGLHESRSRSTLIYMHDSVTLTRDLRSALSASELTIAYQMQYELGDHAREGNIRPVTVEALCRWRHPALGVVPPDMFIPLAEDAGFLDELDIHILGRAAVQVADWRASGFDLGLAANASPSRFSLAYAESVVETLERTRLDPTVLTIEVTETPAPQLRPEMRSAMELLRSIGVAISVDDFDGDATTLAMLDTLPIDEVKIDRSLTQRSDSQADDVIAEVIDISSARGWRTVAEGIETAEDLERSLRRSCQRGQGFLWGRPTPADQLERLLVGG